MFSVESYSVRLKHFTRVQMYVLKIKGVMDENFQDTKGELDMDLK